jgi:OOP family OmpA-OmpF porin
LLASIEFAPAFEKPPPPPVPVLDRDGDGVLDNEDACPDEPGVRTSDPKTNGCPPPKDRDGDGITDDVDACPDQPGVKSVDPKKNGCPPPPDRDGDTITDDVDACPDAAGEPNPDPKKNGCPVARVEQGQIKIREQVQFAYNSAVILKTSDFIIEAVTKILQDHPEIKKVSIEGHTDSKGGDAFNKALSQQRANAVMKALIKKGIDKKRLSAKGYGEEKPLDTNDTEEGRANNRRVEFHIVEQEGALGEGATSGTGASAPPGAAPSASPSASPPAAEPATGAPKKKPAAQPDKTKGTNPY